VEGKKGEEELLWGPRSRILRLYAARATNLIFVIRAEQKRNPSTILSYRHSCTSTTLPAVYDSTLQDALLAGGRG
jgi:hypothetical protein